MEIKIIAIIGATDLGQRVAHAACLSGYRTILEDISPAALEQGIAWIAQRLDEELANGSISAEVRDAALDNLCTASTAEDASREADLIIETISDELEAKLELFTIFDKFAKPGAILASTTTSLSITDIAGITFCAERCIGMRFFADEPREKRLELARGRETSEAVVEACWKVGLDMGLEVAIVPDIPEFATGCPECGGYAAGAARES